MAEGMEHSDREKKLLARERYWMAELRTIYFGLNDRDDLKLELRRNKYSVVSVDVHCCAISKMIDVD